MDRTHRTVFAMLLLSWAVFLGVQSGQPTDETEHCHVAWLIGHEHQQPIRDFCQHHQPPLWDILQLYFHLVADGPEILYFGRALVLICTGLSVLAFFLLAGRLARRNNPESPFPWMAGSALSVSLDPFQPGFLVNSGHPPRDPLDASVSVFTRPLAPRRQSSTRRPPGRTNVSCGRPGRSGHLHQPALCFP